MLAYVLLPLVAEEGDDGPELGVGFADLPRGDEVGAAGGADEEAVLTGEVAHLLDGLLGVDGESVVHQAPVALEDAGDESVGDAFDEVVPDLAAQDRR